MLPRFTAVDRGPLSRAKSGDRTVGVVTDFTPEDPLLPLEEASCTASSTERRRAAKCEPHRPAISRVQERISREGSILSCWLSSAGCTAERNPVVVYLGLRGTNCETLPGVLGSSVRINQAPGWYNFELPDDVNCEIAAAVDRSAVCTYQTPRWYEFGLREANFEAASAAILVLYAFTKPRGSILRAMRHQVQLLAIPRAAVRHICVRDCTSDCGLLSTPGLHQARLLWWL